MLNKVKYHNIICILQNLVLTLQCQKQKNNNYKLQKIKKMEKRNVEISESNGIKEINFNVTVNDALCQEIEALGINLICNENMNFYVTNEEFEKLLTIFTEPDIYVCE